MDLTPTHQPIDTHQPIELTRETIQAGTVIKLASAHGMRVLTDEERATSIAETLAARPKSADPSGDLWLFGYGSLIWNPAFHFAEQRKGRVHGWHRRFCLWTPLGRGSPEQPGLVLALERGGACTGMAFRLAAEQVACELDILWRREMLSGAYKPRWVKVTTADGPVDAVTFTIDPANPRYAGRLAEDEIVRVVATAVGRLGPCTDYLFKTTQALAELGLEDRTLQRLKRRVEVLLGGKVDCS
ncbi:gamma-glutamylcyclotransferase [Aliidongia dinghuensis]|uniref:glutathione-specific gamma-glutamylcyclotransferase n=1 Tax=Aliidongia dinghuensis TaxID=1867774 RepID=A0A8J2YQC9_9PROT|nr:gamma-glutamylcyclotransferase [Aliidongia dinghuensis]GGF07967.1 gamma-glutamylcyclotransferase [Aliidongia dinghuensis]